MTQHSESVEETKIIPERTLFPAWGIVIQCWQVVRPGKPQHGLAVSSFIVMQVSDWSGSTPMWSISLDRDIQPLSDHLLPELLRSHYKMLYTFKNNYFVGSSERQTH